MRVYILILLFLFLIDHPFERASLGALKKNECAVRTTQSFCVICDESIFVLLTYNFLALSYIDHLLFLSPHFGHNNWLCTLCAEPCNYGNEKKEMISQQTV